MKKTLFLFVFFLISSYFVDAQTKKEIKKQFLVANELLDNERFEKAGLIYSKLLKSDKDNLELTFLSGICKLKTGKENDAIENFNTIINSSQKENAYTKASLFQKAKAYHNLYQFDSEIEVLKSLTTLDLKEKEKIEVEIELKKADNAKELFFDFKPIVIKRLDILNSGYDDHTPIPTANGSKLYFTSKRKGGISGDKLSKEGKFFEDIWLWEDGAEPINIGEPVNTLDHDATGGLSLDGNTIFIYKSNKRVKGDIYSSTFTNDKWSAPKKLGKNINRRRTVERHAALSPDGKKLYFSSDRKKGSKGGRDIWVSTLQENNKWGEPTSLNINTEYDEESPYMLADGNTFYFSSKGHKGLGGYDIFKCHLQDDGSFSEPENIGFPINTIEDDVFFFPLSNEKTAYFTRRKFKDAEIYKTLFPSNTLIINSLISGKRFDTDKYLLDSTSIDVIDVNSEIKPDNYTLNISKANYNTVVTNDKDYKFYYDYPDYVFDTKDINIEDMFGKDLIKETPILIKIESGKTEKFKNLSFKKENSDLNNFSSIELDLIAKNLKKYDNLVVNFSGQDNNISTERKTKAIEYLKSKGVDKDKIFIDLSPRTISDNNLEYTIYDTESIEKIIKDKETEAIAIAEENKKKEITLEIENLYFNFDKYKMQVVYNEDLNTLAKYLSDNTSARIRIIGYTDAVGSKAYNSKLSMKRATTVQDYLISKGASISQIETSAYGEDNPITFNKRNGRYFEPSKKFNRRVEFYVVSQGTPRLNIVQFKNVPIEMKKENYIINYKK